MPHRPRPTAHSPLPFGLLALCAALGVGSPQAMTPHPPNTFALSCQVQARVLAPAHIDLHFRLRNDGPQAVQLLRWGSPFEGAWFAPFVRVQGAQGELPYRGAKMKRGDPAPDDYLALRPGQTAEALVRLEEAFDWSAAGRELQVSAQWRWHDAQVAGRSTTPRTRDRHQGLDQACGSLRISL